MIFVNSDETEPDNEIIDWSLNGLEQGPML
jgi:hypothetical protein